MKKKAIIMDLEKYINVNNSYATATYCPPDLRPLVHMCHNKRFINNHRMVQQIIKEDIDSICGESKDLQQTVLDLG